MNILEGKGEINFCSNVVKFVHSGDHIHVNAI